MNTELMGIKINGDSFLSSLDRAFNLINGDKVSQVVTINPEMIEYALGDGEFKKVLDEAEMVIPDGVGVKIALKIKGYNAERIPGIDFARTLVDWCAKNDKPIAVIGAKEEVVVKAVINLQKETENLKIVYYHNGYFDNDEEIFNELKNNEARLILVALGSPKQEFFIHKAKQILPPCLMIGIGGSLDVWSGEVKRAPKFYQRLGLEWLYRTVTQPERFKRIFPALPKFLWKVITYKEPKVQE